MNAKGLRLSVYRWASGDCSNGGLSGRVNYVTLVSDDPDCPGQVFEPDADAPAVRMVKRRVFPGQPEYVHLEPVAGDGRRFMAGGAFAYSCDSRYAEMTGVRYPVSLHDRAE